MLRLNQEMEIISAIIESKEERYRNLQFCLLQNNGEEGEER